MNRPVCSRCARRHECRFRQPGTWAIECELYREELASPGVISTPADTETGSPRGASRAESDRVLRHMGGA